MQETPPMVVRVALMVILVLGVVQDPETSVTPRPPMADPLPRDHDTPPPNNRFAFYSYLPVSCLLARNFFKVKEKVPIKFCHGLVGAFSLVMRKSLSPPMPFHNFFSYNQVKV